MDDLSNNVYRYYLDHFNTMPFDKKFHFASRLYLWSGDTDAHELLGSLRPEFTHQENPKAAIDEVLSYARSLPSHGSKNAAELRRPFFERYPSLKAYVMVLFRINFLQTAYGIEARQFFYEFFPETEVESCVEALLHDPEALAVLSTHAINFLYLYERVIKQTHDGFSPEAFLTLGRNAYDRNDKIHMQLLIYLYTHCVIGESQFYFRRPAAHLDTYREMMAELEQLLDSRYDDINLDNKFEFLVCMKLLGLEANSLKERIFDEAARSVSPDGHYLIDVHNHNPQSENITLDKSEHRNVLFIMANRTFKPKG